VTLVRPDAVAPLAADPVGPERTGLDLLRAVLIVLSMVATSLALHLVVVSSLQHRSAQQEGYSAFRRALAEGTAPVGPSDGGGRQLAHGTPVAYLEIPTIHVHEVVVEGTAGTDLTAGPGHRRDSPLPGQSGTSVLLGRQASCGGPFNRLGDLGAGAKITVTTGQGVARFTVTSRRYGGEPTPPPLRAGQGRLLLVSAAGPSYLPSQVLRVDADLTSAAFPAPPRGPRPSPILASERIMGADTSTLWALVLWLQALIATAVAIVWSWHRWGHPQTWIVFFPVTSLLALLASAQALRLLPNLI